MAESSTQSKTKRHKLPPKNDAKLDWISDLPDSLLCLILSFLPTKEAIATSILSNRWKLLWTLVPKLDLDTETIDPSVTFEHIVSKVLSLQQIASLRNFRLRFLFRCSSFVNHSYLHTWLLIAASRNVEELNLEIYFDWEALKWKPQKLPRSILSCKSLVVLKLRGDIHIDFATDSSLSFQFPNLKILHLLYLFNLRECFSRLLSSCPVLEELSYEEDLDISKIFAPRLNITLQHITLKRLNITLRESEIYKLEINAPALEYFNFEGDLGDIKIQEKLDNLVEANVDIRTFESEFWRDYRHEENCHKDRIFQLLAELNNVKFLSFLFHGAECVRLGYIYPLSYQNLVRLEFKVNDCNWHVLQDLLQNAPNLEILDVTKSYDCLKHDLGWKEPPDDLDDLSSHLKSLCYRGFEGLESEVGFLKYILKHERVLKKVTIQVSGGESKESVLEKLSLFPRRSTMCLFTVV